MKLTTALAGIILPALIAADDTSVTSTTQCLTVPGGSSTSCPTNLRSRSTTITEQRVRVTEHPTILVTSVTTESQNSTEIDYSTVTLSQHTDILTNTSLTTKTVTATAPPVITVTTVTVNITSTITTNGQFTPVRSTLPDATGPAPAPIPRKLRRGIPDRFLRVRDDPVADSILNADAPAPPGKNCRRVICQALTTTYVNTTITRTAPPTTSTVSSVTISIVPVTTRVIITTQPGDAKTTIEVTATINTTETTTPTTTLTQTSNIVITEQASATAFCNATNYADGANEEGLKQVMFDNGASNSNSLTFARQIVDAEACCQACSANPACSAWFFLDDKYGCRFYQSTTGKCNNGDFTFSVGLDGPAGSGFTVGNGNCGDFDDTYECETCG